MGRRAFVLRLAGGLCEFGRSPAADTPALLRRIMPAANGVIAAGVAHVDATSPTLPRGWLRAGLRYGHQKLYAEREVAHVDVRVDGTIEMQTAAS